MHFVVLPVPHDLKADLEKAGGHNYRRAVCVYGTGECVRALCGVEPTEAGLQIHISVSVAPSTNVHVEPSRPPTDHELNEAVKFFTKGRTDYEEPCIGGIIRHVWLLRNHIAR